MTAVELQPEVLEWAVARSGRSEEELEKSLPQLSAWRSGEKKPTFKQLEKLAQATRTPLGFFFLPAPPAEKIPIPDLRTLSDRGVRQPSADLLETIYGCQQRQNWYEDYARANHHAPLTFVGSAIVGDNPTEVAERIRQFLGFEVQSRMGLRTWEEGLRHLISLIEDAGIMVMVNGIVGCNTKRKLDPEEFRGFALSHPLAPLIFVNGADSKSAQMFTLAHELAHLWLGETALSDAAPSAVQGTSVERWCNQVAAELLLPISLVPRHIPDGLLFEYARDLSKKYKVSIFVVLRRLHDAGALGKAQFWSAYNSEKERLEELSLDKEPGGQFYPTHANRIGRTFGRALAADALEGRTSFTEAFRLMAVKKLATFEELANRFGVGA